MRTFLSGVRAASRRNQPSLPGSHCRGGGGLEGDGVSHDSAGYGEKHEGSLTEHEVCTKVDLVYTP